jgi:hypothetical protein
MLKTYCERCENEELDTHADAIADICDSCADEQGAPIVTARDEIETGRLERDPLDVFVNG